jgi:tetratricopeptide repeat protein
MFLFGFARLSGLLGDIEKARTLFMQSAESAQRTGDIRVVCSCHSELAHILRRHGEIDEALDLYREVLPRWKELGHRSALAHELECVAFILSQKDHPDRALTLLGAADALRAVIDSAMTTPERAEYDEVMSVLHAHVDDKKYRQLWDAGYSMNMEQAIKYALEAVDT